MEIFRDTVFLACAENAYSWASIERLILDNNNWLNFDLTKYQGEKIEVVGKAIAGKSFDSIESLELAFDLAINSTTTNNGGGNSGGNNGGGGSSGGGGGISRSVAGATTPSIAGSPIEVVNTPTTKPVSPFNDIDNISWAKDSINDLAALGIINGKTEDTFDPHANVTREEFVKMAVLAFELRKDGARCNFNDVNRDDWFYTYVSSAVRAGLVNGKSEEIFGVGMDITRQEMAVIIHRATQSLGLKLPLQADLLEFSDAEEIDEYAREAVREMQLAGIINGVGDNAFAPLEGATRAQTAVVIDKLYKLSRPIDSSN